MKTYGSAFDGAAFHCYDGPVRNQDTFHNAFPSKVSRYCTLSDWKSLISHWRISTLQNALGWLNLTGGLTSRFGILHFDSNIIRWRLCKVANGYPVRNTLRQSGILDWQIYSGGLEAWSVSPNRSGIFLRFRLMMSEYPKLGIDVEHRGWWEGWS